MKTKQIKKSEIKRAWHLIDFNNQVLGRTATKIASLLIGKHKVGLTPHVDGGDYVVVINSDKLKVTGKKLSDKVYQRHTGYAGSLKELTLNELMQKDSTKVVWKAVRNMLPKNKLRKSRLKRLKIFKDDNHLYKDKFKTK